MTRIILFSLLALLLAGCDSNPLLEAPSTEQSTTAFDASKRGGNPPPPEPAGLFDPSPAWPLCGRIQENPPAGWTPEDGCPSSRWGSAAFTDGPIASTYGPRPLVSEDYRYDFHRGLDLTTPTGTPVFAVADGVVRLAGPSSGYGDPVVQIKHYRPGATQCTGQGGCYYSNNLHMSGWTVAPGDAVSKGELVGYTGASASGYQHLHFEIRNAPGDHDPTSSWQRDAIHPLTVLPHPETSGAGNMTVTILDVDLSTPGNPRPLIEITMPSGDELDLRRIEVEVYEKSGKLTRITQPGDTPVGTTPEGTGYLVEPSAFDLVDWNRMYTYKNSSNYPWSSFTCGGAYESPYCADLPPAYDPNVHMDRQAPYDTGVGEFNGTTVTPEHHNAQSTTYRLRVRFDVLAGPQDASAACIKARAVDTGGTATGWSSFGDCSKGGKK